MATSGWSGRLVVDLVGDPHHGRLAESRLVAKDFAYGGERTLQQLAFAAALLGHDVELRGWLDQTTFEELRERLGVAPRVGLPPRAPQKDDFVVVPEGWSDPLAFLQLSLSPARLGIAVLAATGLFGWPFTDEPWERPDPLTVPLESLGRPEHYRGMRALGFELLTNSPGTAQAAREAGVECALLGTGHPGGAPRIDAEKVVDVVVLTENRWAPLARRALDGVEAVSVDWIERSPHEEVLRRFARARILLWPSRVEGHASIPVEARSVGCVPVALGTNRFALNLDEEHGAVTVPRVEDLAPAVRELLADRNRLEALADRGRDSAAEDRDWDAYVARVERFLAAPALEDPARRARAGAGAAARAAFSRWSAEQQQRLEAVAAELEVAGEHLTAATRRQEELEVELLAVGAARTRELAELESVRRELAKRWSRRAARLARGLAVRVGARRRP